MKTRSEAGEKVFVNVCTSDLVCIGAISVEYVASACVHVCACVCVHVCVYI